MAIKAIYQHHERTLTADLETDLQYREIGIDPVLKMLTAYSEVLGTKIHAITQESALSAMAGAMTIALTLGVAGNFAVATNKFTVAASTGNALIAGTLTQTGIATFTAAPVFTAATASTVLGVDSGKSLVSYTTSGTGTVLALTAGPTFTGTIAGAAMTLSSTLAVTGTSTFTGPIGVGALSTDFGIQVNHASLTSVSPYGVVIKCTFPSTATTSGIALFAQVRTAAASFTMTDAVGVSIVSPSVGAASSITNLYGLKIANQSVGGTLNYSIFTGTGLVSFGDTTDSTSITTGSVQTLGGLGITKALWVGGLANIAGAVTLQSTLTVTGLLLTTLSATGGACFRLPHGAAPSSPVNGDMWTTTAGLYIRINGATVGPLS